MCNFRRYFACHPRCLRFTAVVSGHADSFTVTDVDLSFFFGEVLPHLDERQRKIVSGAAARALGRGGVKAVAVASGLSLSTVQHGALAVDAGIEPSDRVRAPGAGRPRAEESMPGLVDALDNSWSRAVEGILSVRCGGRPNRLELWLTS
jgi:hypothetical protein